MPSNGDEPNWDWQPHPVLATIVTVGSWGYIPGLVVIVVGTGTEISWLAFFGTGVLLTAVFMFGFMGIWASYRSGVPLRMTYGGWRVDHRRLRRSRRRSRRR